MKATADEERLKLEERWNALSSDIAADLLPKDPNDAKNCYLEIRAGAGGDEAALFAGEPCARTCATVRPRVGRSRRRN